MSAKRWTIAASAWILLCEPAFAQAPTTLPREGEIAVTAMIQGDLPPSMQPVERSPALGGRLDNLPSPAVFDERPFPCVGVWV